MSSRLAMRVLESGLAPPLKPLAAAMALFGRDDGDRIFPSVERLAYLLGVSRRHIERQLSELRACGVLVPQSSLAGGCLPGGRGRTTVYFLDANALPTRDAFEPRRPRQGSTSENPDASVGVSAETTPTSETGTPTPVSENPDMGVATTPTCTSSNLLSDLPDRRVRQETEPSALRAAFSPQEEKEKPPEASKPFVYACSECEWTGSLRESVSHYRNFKHKIDLAEARSA